MVVVRFSAPLGAVNGATVTAGGKAVGGTPRLSPRDAARLVIPLSAGGRSGDFRVQWEVRSADGHALTGRATFTIEGPPLRASAARVAHRVLEAAAGLHAPSAGSEPWRRRPHPLAYMMTPTPTRQTTAPVMS
jgi:hypothetical protein